MNHWKWRVSGYYNDTVKPPKIPADIGDIVVQELPKF